MKGKGKGKGGKEGKGGKGINALQYQNMINYQPVNAGWGFQGYCWNCRELGHTQYECPKYLSELGVGGADEATKETQMVETDLSGIVRLAAVTKSKGRSFESPNGWNALRKLMDDEEETEGEEEFPRLRRGGCRGTCCGDARPKMKRVTRRQWRGKKEKRKRKKKRQRDKNKN